jgi:DNA-binding transcriptional MerR regulator
MAEDRQMMDSRDASRATGLRAEAAMPGDTEAAAPVETTPTLFTIGDLAREFGVTLRALRFYEDKGLLSPKREGLTRLYSAVDRSRLTVILKGKRLGFTLAEIRGMVAAQEGAGAEAELRVGRDKCVEQIAILEKQKVETEAAIAELKRTVAALDGMLARGQ